MRIRVTESVEEIVNYGAGGAPRRAMMNDEVKARLESMRAELVTKAVAAAEEAAAEYRPALLEPVVELQRQIAAIDFALALSAGKPTAESLRFF